MAVAELEAQAPPRKKPIWLFVILATLISAVAAGVFAGFSGDEVTDPVKVAERGRDYAMGVEAAFAFAIPGVAAVATWLVLLILVARRGAPIWKAFVALFIIALVSVVVAVPIRVFTFTEHVQADEEAASALYERTRARVNVLRGTVFDEEGFVRMPGGGPPVLSSDADLQRQITVLREARDRFSAYRTEVARVVASGRDELERMDVFHTTKATWLERYDRVFRPHVSRHLELMEQEMTKELDAAMFLRDNRASWVLQEDGVVAFTNRNVMHRYAALMAELDSIGSELDRLDGALGNVDLPSQAPTEPTEPPT